MMAMPSYEISDSVEFVAQELLETPADQRPAMLESIAKSLTRWLLRDNPGVGLYEVSSRVSQFVAEVRRRVDEEEQRLQEEW
jgi:hypothetical protein